MLSFAIQFVELSRGQVGGARPEASVPERSRAYIADFDASPTHDERNGERFSYRIPFKRKLVHRPGQAGSVIEFIDPNAELAKTIDKEYWVTKDVEHKKYRAKDVVAAAHEAGFKKLSAFGDHVAMWKGEEAKNPGEGHGVDMQGTWYWYRSWVDRVVDLCKAAGDQYR